jgi:Fe2+ or Zn2+ uptake regulation protein
MERNTYQKQIVLDYLRCVNCHPSVDEVYENCKKRLPQLSRGTVYRILNNFKEKGIIQEINTSVAHYDGDMTAHGHFICCDCGSIQDIFEKECRIKIKKTKFGKIKSSQVLLYGTCDKCK